VIPTDLLNEWKNYEISGQVIKAMQEEKDRLTTAMEFGQFVNPSSMEETFGQIAQATGEMKGLNTFFQIIGEDEDED